ncbi:MAG: DUF3298 and DUF4163 domain-containing protein [Candidatus Margulisiibacteriota bacterium]
MKKRSAIITAAALLCLLALAFVFLYEYKDKEIIEETNTSKTKINYPALKNKMINKDIEKFINRNISDFRKLALPPANDPRHYKNELYITYDKPFITRKYASIVFYVMTYDGGAHPTTAVITKNYNAQTGKELRLADICPGDKTKIREMIIGRLMKQVNRPDKEWITRGVNQDDLETFAFRFTDITFYFGQYQVAPYAQGIQKVKFKLSTLIPIEH